MTKRVVGSCTGCGQCCRLLVVPATSATVHKEAGVVEMKLPVQAPEDEDFLMVRGAVRMGPDRVYVRYDRNLDRPPVTGMFYASRGAMLVRSTCPHLKDDNRCGIYEARPQACRDYPVPSDNLKIVPECGYSIVEDGE